MTCINKANELVEAYHKSKISVREKKKKNREDKKRCLILTKVVICDYKDP